MSATPRKEPLVITLPELHDGHASCGARDPALARSSKSNIAHGEGGDSDATGESLVN